MADEGRITETRSTDPRIAAYDARLVALQSDALSQRQTLKGLSSDIQANIAKAKYLAQSQPLSDWPAMVSRLEAVIPLFRTENARQRGIDVDNILAFQVHRPLELPPVSDAEKFHLPGELGVSEAEFSRLRSDIEATSALTDKDFDEVGA
jgi:hypothetical protein